MNFSKIFMFVFACIMFLATVTAAPEPKWKVFKKIARSICTARSVVTAVDRDTVVTDVSYNQFDTVSVAQGEVPGCLPYINVKERVGQHIRDGVIKAGPAVAVAGEVASLAGK